MTPWEIVAVVVYFATVGGSLVFVARRLTTHWWEYPEGMALLLQHLMLVGFGTSAVLGLTVDQNYPGRVAVTIVLMFGFGVAVWWLTILQEQAWRRAQADRRPSPETHQPPVEDHQLG
jgi:small-conductance mechanosensitive channel